VGAKGLGAVTPGSRGWKNGGKINILNEKYETFCTKEILNCLMK
jgi:hypothetical protein